MYQGLNLEQYMQYTGMTMDKLREQYREPSEKKVKTQLVLEAVKEAEKIEVSDEELDAQIAEFAKMQNKDVDEFKKGMKDNELEYIKDRAVYDKLIKMLVDAAKVRKPAKRKPAAKKEEAEAPAKEEKTEE